MSETQGTHPNNGMSGVPDARAPWGILLSVILAVAGAVTWWVAAGLVAQAQEVYDISKTLVGGDLFADSTPIVAPTVWMWIGIVATAAGVALAIVFFIRRERAADRAVRPQNLSERMSERANEQPSVAAELATLADLHERGVLSDAEFAAAKSRALNG